MKEKNGIVTAAWVLLALLTAAVTTSAALTLWSSQYTPRFSGLVSVEDMDVFTTYMSVTAAQDTLEALTLLVGVIAYVVLLVRHVLGKQPLTSKQKWIYTAVTAAALVVPSLVMGLCDPVNALLAYYLFTPLVLVGVLLACVLLEFGLKALQNRKETMK
ncbi:MAG: hypothetical protein IJO42_03865 [Clostridia bacterium]|nr:hypothetical protein [Clostridia bacterium]